MWISVQCEHAYVRMYIYVIVDSTVHVLKYVDFSTYSVNTHTYVRMYIYVIVDSTVLVYGFQYVVRYLHTYILNC